MALLTKRHRGASASALTTEATAGAKDVRAAGWTTEKSSKGLEVLETEHSSRNVLAQYIHNIFKLHFPVRNLCF